MTWTIFQRLRRLPSLLISIGTFTTLGCTAAPSVRIAPRTDNRAALRARITSLIAAPSFRTATWAVLAVDPERHDTLYAHNASLLMVPASNMKIVTSALALSQLGGDFRFTTTFSAHGTVSNGVLHGDLVVTGRGDPTLSDHVRGSARLAMDSLADSIIARGVRTITGHIYSGADNFPGPHVGEGWGWDDLTESYGAGVDELLFNEGMGRVVVHTAGGDSIVSTAPVSDPTRDYLTELDSALALRGVRSGLGVAESFVPRDGTPLDTLFVSRSIPLREILPYFLKPSQNQIGEVLLRSVALERTGVGTPDSGIAIAKRQLRAWGIPRDGYEVRDGSGMARTDLVSPATLVRILDVMRASPDYSAFYTALPIAGVDGTLSGRMRGTAAANNVHAKTGSLQWVRSLSGYVTDADGRRLIFSVLANKWTTPASEVTATADSIAVALASFRQ
jgi:D-alanyl-D-alanine carboxypeptidase/D-alanyl-D-alanine-endopeptidase (penicillin-binding protein 4)